MTCLVRGRKDLSVVLKDVPGDNPGTVVEEVVRPGSRPRSIPSARIDKDETALESRDTG